MRRRRRKNPAPDPSYPGAHAVISAAGAEVLISFFRTRLFEFTVTSEVTSGMRSFTSFPAAAQEATLSRVFAGQHFLFDLAADQRERANRAKHEPQRLATLRERYAAWEATMPALPADATFSIPYGKADLAQPS